MSSLRTIWVNNFKLSHYCVPRMTIGRRRNKWRTPIKGTVSSISSDPICKDGNVWFTTVPLILCPTYALDIHVLFLLPVYFQWRFFSANVNCAEEIMEIFTEIFWARKRRYLSDLGELLEIGYCQLCMELEPCLLMKFRFQFLQAAENEKKCIL